MFKKTMLPEMAMKRMNFILASCVFVLMATNYVFFKYMRDSVYTFNCRAVNIYTTDENNVLAYNVGKLHLYNVHVAFEILDMPDGFSYNKLQSELIIVGGNFSKTALNKVKQEYYIQSVHRCMLITFPFSRFTVIDYDYYKTKKKFINLLVIQLFITSVFFALGMCAIGYEIYLENKQLRLRESIIF